MSDQNAGGLGPADDAAVERYLTILPAFTPGPGFANRVLARVWRPIPPWLRRFRERVLTPRRVWTAVGILAAGSFLWQAGVALAAASHPELVAEGLRWTTEVGLPVARDAAAGYLTAVGLAAATALASVLPAGPALTAWAVGAALVIAVSAFGLYLTMAGRRGGREVAR